MQLTNLVSVGQTSQILQTIGMQSSGCCISGPTERHQPMCVWVQMTGGPSLSAGHLAC